MSGVECRSLSLAVHLATEEGQAETLLTCVMHHGISFIQALHPSLRQLCLLTLWAEPDSGVLGTLYNHGRPQEDRDDRSSER
jgi:hypothetical protein